MLHTLFDLGSRALRVNSLELDKMIHWDAETGGPRVKLSLSSSESAGGEHLCPPPLNHTNRVVKLATAIISNCIISGFHEEKLTASFRAIKEFTPTFLDSNLIARLLWTAYFNIF